MYPYEKYSAIIALLTNIPTSGKLTRILIASVSMKHQHMSFRQIDSGILETNQPGFCGLATNTHPHSCFALWFYLLSKCVCNTNILVIFVLTLQNPRT